MNERGKVGGLITLRASCKVGVLILVSGSEKFVMFATLIYKRDVISHWNKIVTSCSIIINECSRLC